MISIRTYFYSSAVLVVTPLGFACAQSVSTSACSQIDNTNDRLTCFDKAFPRVAPRTVAAETPPVVPAPASRIVDPVPLVSLRVLQQGDYDNYANADVVAKPAIFSVQRKDGIDSSLVKLGVLAVGRAVNDLGWQPFASVAWDRDTSGPATKHKDTREVGAGITGTLLQTDDAEWSLFGTARYKHRNDLYGASGGNSWGMHGSLIKLSWVNAQPAIFVPYAGFLSDQRTSAADGAGRWDTAYVGSSLTVPLTRLFRGLTISGTYERFKDTSIPSGELRRSSKFAKADVAIEFTDPEDKTAKLRPTISLSRQVGDDVRGGTGSQNKTILSLGVKYN